MQTTGDAWRYCAHLDNPEAIKQLVQAVLTAHATIEHARRDVSPEYFASAPDWAAVGHPAGQ